MADKEHIQRVFDDGKSIGAAMHQAVRKEIEKKAKLGQYVVFGGKIE